MSGLETDWEAVGTRERREKYGGAVKCHEMLVLL